MKNPGMYTTPTPASIKGLLQDLLVRQEQIDSATRRFIDNLGPKERHAHSNIMFLMNMNTRCIKNLLDLVGCPQPVKPQALEAPAVDVQTTHTSADGDVKDMRRAVKQISIDV